MTIDVSAARAEGYSDDEIADHLAKSLGTDIAAARKEGYSGAELVDYLSQQKPKKRTDAQVAVARAEATYPARMTLSKGGQPKLEKQPLVEAPYSPEAAAETLGKMPTEKLTDLASRDEGVNRLAGQVLERRNRAPRRGEVGAFNTPPKPLSVIESTVQQAGQEDAAASRVEPGIGDTIASIPARMTAARTQAGAQILRLASNVDERLADLEAFQKDLAAGREPQPHMTRLYPTIDRPNQELLRRNPQELAKRIAALKQEQTYRVDQVESAQADLRAARPRNAGTLDTIIGGAAESLPPTLAGIAAGLATRSPAVGMAIAGGGGALEQGASAFHETLSSGDEARKRLSDWQQIHGSQRAGYLQAVVQDPTTNEPIRRSAQRVLDTLKSIDDRQAVGILSPSAAGQMRERALGSFERDAVSIDRDATLGSAKVGAVLQGAAEGVGEMIPIGVALKAGAPARARIFNTLVSEFGQEFATQVMQTADSWVRYDPTMTMGQLFKEALIAGASGAVMGGVIGPIGAAQQWSVDRAAKTERSRLFSKAMDAGVASTDISQRAPLAPTAVAPQQPRPQAGTRADLEAIMADPRPLEEIRGEQAAQDAAAVAQAGQQIGAQLGEQAVVDGEQARADTATAAAVNGMPGVGESTRLTWPDGEVQTGKILDLYETTNEATGEKMMGAKVELDDGSVMDITTADARIERAPIGEGTPQSPIVADTPEAVDQAAKRAAADYGNLYVIDNAINADGPTQIKVIRHQNGSVAIDDGGNLVDVTGMINAGFSIEKAIAMTFGDHPQGAEPDVSKVRPAGAPTEGQKQAGNYRKGHVDFHGLNVTIENPQGSVRRGTDRGGNAWEVTMPAHYGYVKRTEGADGDQVDVYIGPNVESRDVFVVDQIDPDTGKFDEHKVMLGFGNILGARRAYAAAFQDGQGRDGAITRMSMDEFKAWLKNGDTTKPLKYVEPKGAQPTKENIADIGQAGAAIVENLYRKLHELVQAGVTTEDGRPSVVLQVAKRIKDRGVAITLEKLKAIAADVSRAQDQGLKGKEYQNAMRAVVEKYAPSTGAGPVTGGAREPTKENGDAEGVRGDAGQVREGSPEGQPGLQPGAEQSGGDLQQPQPEPADVGGAPGGGTTQEPGEGAGEGSGGAQDVPRPPAVGEAAPQTPDQPQPDDTAAAADDADDGEDAGVSTTEDPLLDDIAKMERHGEHVLRVGGKKYKVSIRSMIGKSGKREYFGRVLRVNRNTGGSSYVHEKNWPPKLRAEVTTLVDAARAAAEASAAEQARREAERELFHVVLQRPGWADAAAKSVDEFMAAMKVEMGREELLKTLPADVRNALEALADNREFWRSVHKEARLRAKHAELQKNRDPEVYKAALAAAMEADNVQSPELARAFTQGWDHAIQGRTKSTLSGEYIAVVHAGYESASRWIQTEDGAAYYKGKRGKKLENTGADLKRAMDEHRKKIEAAKGSWQVAWSAIDKETQRGDLFAAAVDPNATPGAKALIAEMRSYVATFPEWLVGSGPLQSMWRYDYSGSARHGVEGFLSGKNYLTNRDATESERIAIVQKAALEYLDRMKDVLSVIENVRDIAALRDSVDFYLFGGKQGDDVTMFKHPKYSDRARINAEVLKPSDLLLVTRSNSVQRAIAHENDAAFFARAEQLRRPKLDSIARVNATDYRNGRDVTPQEFKEKFGFADIGFGSWVGAKEDQDNLNYSYDAFMDLADVIGVDPKVIGLEGTLHFVIGALGSGKHAAHYSPNHPRPGGGSVPVINVTKTKGDGSLAHEWFHALDYHLGKGRAATDLRGNAVNEIRRRLSGTYDIGALRDGMDRFLLGRSWYRRHKNDPIESARIYLSYADPTQTAYKTEADRLGKDYWGNSQELWARAGESWVFDMLLERERSSPYLVTDWVADSKVTKANGYRGTPYPAGEERAAFARYFKAFFKSLTIKDGKIVVDEALWDEHNPKDREAWENAKKELSKQAPQIREELLGMIDQRERAAKLAKMEEELRAKQAAAAAAAAAAEEMKPVGDVQGDLSDADLSALFDEAAAEVREELQERPDSSPGQNAVSVTVVDNPPPGGWTEADKVPKPGDSPRKSAEQRKIEEHFAIGNIILSGYWQNHDRVVDFNWNNGNWSVAVIGVKKDGDKWVDRPDERVRWHATRPELDGPEHKRDKVVDRVEQPSSTEKPEAAMRAAAMAKEAAKLGVEGVGEALQGLAELFGGKRLKSFPAGFDAEAYAKAKPHFKAALERFQAAGRTLKDLFKFLVEQFGEGIKPYALQFAKDEALTNQLAAKPGPGMELANRIASMLMRGEKIRNNAELMTFAREAFAGSEASGAFSTKDAYDALEAGVNIYLRKTGVKADTSSPTMARAAVEAIEMNVIANIPTQNRRDNEQDEFQQFSTPPTLAYLVAWLGNVRAGETVLEPSAGLGGLTVIPENMGARLAMNELSSRRSELLRSLFPGARIFKEDASQLHNILPDDVRPSLVVMNPPFSATAGRVEGKRDTMEGARHIEQALKRLEKGGRLVAIVGEGMAADRPAFREWWEKIKRQYNVRANVGIDGRAYMKYGTTFGVQLLVIDKDGATKKDPVTAAGLMPQDVPALLNGVRNERPEGSGEGEPVADQPGGQEPAAGGVEGQGGSAPAGADAVGPGKRPRNPPAGTGTPDAGAGGAADQDAGRPAAPSGDAVRPGAGGGGRPGRGGSDRGGKPDASGGDRAGEPARDDDRPGGVGVESKDSERAQGELTDAVYEAYTPKRLKITGAKPHPGKLVESAAMASVDPPAPTYTPNLPREVIEKGLLSLAQLEAVVYAGQAHQQMLPGTQGKQERRGFFIGDGTGVGKGREIAGIILDNWRQGRKRAIWVSEKQGLHADAQRDFSGIGGDAKLIVKHNGTPAKDKIALKNGVLFTTYAMLRGGEKQQATVVDGKKVTAGKSRIQQLVEWLGDDFDGVIVFDEAHNMANAVGKKGERGKIDASKQAQAGLDLQRLLPRARVVYVSATGATEVSNLAYGARLGLWGEGTAFAARQDFLQKVEAGGVAVMELVAQNMKALGVYIARSLSYDGVTYEKVTHEMDDIQRDLYDKLADTWAMVMDNIQAALEETGQANNGRAKSAALSRFYGTQQRFFNQLITAMQMPTVLAEARKAMAEGNAVVMQLVNTNEAEQERQAKAAEAEGEEVEEMEFGPMDSLIEYVKLGFPVQQYEEQSDGEKTIWVPVLDGEGNPVLNKEMLAQRDALVKELEQMKGSSAIPGNPIDLLIEAFGDDKVAEVTGRSRRFINKRGADGQVKLVEQKRGAAAAASDAKDFQDDKKSVLVFSDAGGTGFSFQADLSKKNQRKRRHFLLQPGWRADKAVQGFGRTHRTNQASEPIYVLPSTTLKAQKRFMSSIARRLDQLGALTKGQRQTGSQVLFSAKDNLESKYATAALETMLMDMYAGRGALDFAETTKKLGLDNLIDPKTGALNKSKLPTIPKFLNRLLAVRIADQDLIFDEFYSRMEEAVEKAIAEGKYDDGLETLRAKRTRIEREELVHTDERSGAGTIYYDIETTHDKKLNTFEDIQRTVGEELDQIKSRFAAAITHWYRNEKTGKVHVIVTRGKRVDPENQQPFTVAMRWGVEGRYTFITNADHIISGSSGSGKALIRYTKLTEEEAREAWKKEYDAAPREYTENVHMIGGAILPVWNRIEAGYRVVRAQTDDGRRIIGRVVEQESLSATLRNLGVGSAVSKMTPEAVFETIMSGKTVLLANGHKLAKVKILGSDRIEVVGYLTSSDQRLLEEMGAFTERIEWNKRTFIPTDHTKAAKLLERLFGTAPPVDIEAGGTGEEKLSLGARAASRPAASMDQLARQVAAIAKQLAPTARLSMVERMFGGGTAALASGATSAKRQEVAGSYRAGENLISVALAYDDPTVTVRHEAIHHLKAAGLFTALEWQVLARKARSEWMKKYGVPDEEEGVAYAFQGFRAGDKPKGLIRTAFNKLREFLTRLGNLLRGLGFQSPADIFAMVDSGEVGRRGEQRDLGAMTAADYGALPQGFRDHIRRDREAMQELYSAATRAVFVHDPKGSPLLSGSRTDLVDPQDIGISVSGGAVVQSMIARDGRTVGVVTLRWNGSPGAFGSVQELWYIKTSKKLRGQGIAEDVVRTILEHNAGKPLHAINILPEAHEFWRKMGAEFVETNEGEDGFLTLDQYRNAAAARESARARRSRSLDFTGADVREGAGGPATAPRDAGPDLADLDFTGAKFAVAGRPGGLPDNVIVVNKQTSRDLDAVRRFFWTPRNAFQKWPALASLQQFATGIDLQLSKTQRRLSAEFDDIRSRLNDEQWDQVSDVLWVGDAEGREFSAAELRGELEVTDQKVIDAYLATRELVTKMGRLVDMHRRSMMPRYRDRKQAILNRMRALRNMSDDEFRALYGRRTRLRAKLRSGRGDPEAIARDLEQVESQMRDMRQDLDEFVALQQELDQIDAILGSTSVRRKVGYVPHKFFGTFAVYRLEESEVIDPETLDPVLDESGHAVTETVHVLVAGEHGFYPTQQAAVDAAKEHAAQHPDAQIVVRPVQFQFPNSEATTLTDAAYWRLMAKAGRALELEGQDLRDAMQGVARRRFRRRIAGFAQMRKGVEGFSKDMERVMRAHIGEVTRYVFLDKLKFRAINTMERMGLSPFRSAQTKYPTLQPMLEAYLRDMNGAKQPGETTTDDMLDRVMSSTWGRPAYIGAGAGLATASALFFGISTSPFIGALLGSYVGVRLYRSLTAGGEFKTRRLTSDILSDMAHLKLGAFFNAMSAIVNLTQTAVNTLPILKPKYTMIGMMKLEEAIRSKLMGKPNNDWRLLERTDTVSAHRYTETHGYVLAKEGRLAHYSLLMFDKAEQFNRAVAFLGAYHRAIDAGRTQGDAFRTGEKVMLFTQHNYGNSNKPEVLRNVFLRVPLQFKNYLIQQLSYTWELGRRAATGGQSVDIQIDRDALAYHLTSTFLVAGAIGMPALALLSAIIEAIFDFDPMDELKKLALEMQGAGKLAAGAWQVIARGMPALVGEDMSGRAGMGENFMPSKGKDLWGPWFNTIANAIKLGEAQARFVDQVVNMSPGAGKPLKALEAAANGMPLTDLILRPKAFFEALADDRIDWTNPWKNGYTEFDETMIGKRDLARMAVGSTPIAVSEARTAVQSIESDKEKDRRKTKLYMNRIVLAAKRYEQEPAELDRVLNNIADQMAADEFVVSPNTIQRGFRDSMTPRLLRSVQSAPKKMRPEIQKMVEPLIQRQEEGTK